MIASLAKEKKSSVVEPVTLDEEEWAEDPTVIEYDDLKTFMPVYTGFDRRIIDPELEHRLRLFMRRGAKKAQTYMTVVCSRDLMVTDHD